MTRKPSADRLAKLYDKRRSTKTNGANSPWTPERLEALAKLWKEGLSCSQIARELGGGATRNSVIGKVTRLGLPKRLVTHPKANISKRRPGVVSTRPRRPMAPKGAIPPPWAKSRVLPEPLPGDMETLKGDAWAALPGSEPKPLLDVAAACGCRWPIGEDRPYLFCGNPVHKGSFCQEHHALAFHPVRTVDVRPAKQRFKDNRILDMEEA